MLFLVVAALVCAGPYALMKVAGTPGVDMKINVAWTLSISIVVALLAALVRFSAIAANKSRSSPEDLMKKPERNFADQFDERQVSRS